jgi:hypothetical protein
MIEFKDNQFSGSLIGILMNSPLALKSLAADTQAPAGSDKLKRIAHPAGES